MKLVYFLSIFVLTSCFYACKNNQETKTEQKQSLFAPTQWVYPIKENVIHELRCYGELEFDQNKVVPVYAPTAGVAVEVPVETGTYVKKGDVLAVLQSSMITDLQREEVDARSDLDLAKQNRDLSKKMYADGFASQKEVLEAEKSVEKASVNVKRIEELLRLYGASSFSTYTLKAPKAGYVVQRSIKPGMMVRDSYENPLFVISEINTIWVIAYLYQSDIGLVEKDDEAEIRVTGINDTIKGKVSRITNFVDKANKSLQVIIELSNFNERLKPGMFTEVTLLSKDERQVLPAIPTESIVFYNNKNYVTVIDKNDMPQLKLVKTGFQRGNMTYITEGIDENDRVVTYLPLLIFQELYNQQKQMSHNKPAL
ncbi:MAG: efflux RND transporter periplasmic adaptor subunit [Bacteroidales bacterium]|nr:efflux RND transporter periplasmic adaptor subunit [Bacteroidales bacterium]